MHSAGHARPEQKIIVFEYNEDMNWNQDVHDLFRDLKDFQLMKNRLTFILFFYFLI